MKRTFLAKSSSGEPYEVNFEAHNGRMIVHCACKAGAMDQQCKHKRALASGDYEMLYDQSQAQILNELFATTEANELMARLTGEEEALALLEKEKSRLATEEKAIKRRLGDLFAGRA